MGLRGISNAAQTIKQTEEWKLLFRYKTSSHRTVNSNANIISYGVLKSKKKK